MRRVRGARRLPISVIRNEIDKVTAILDLPDLVFPVAGLCLGYPQGGGYVSLRLPRRATTYRDAYDDSALPDAIDDYDRRRDARHAIPKDQHRSNAEFGEAAFYGWSEDKARQAAKAEGAAFPPYLRAHGFSFDLKGRKTTADRAHRSACKVVRLHQTTHEGGSDMTYSRSSSISRRALLGALAATATLPMLGGRAHAAASMEEIKKRGLIAATEDDFRPFEFVKDGKPTGFDNELVEDLRKYAPFEIKQEILPWTGILAGVSTGKYDVAITAAIITKERKQSLDFTSPIADATHYYVKRKADKSITSIKDLSGKTVGVQAGSALLARLPELKMLEKGGGTLGKIVEYTSYPEAYQDLALGRTDFVVNTVIISRRWSPRSPTYSRWVRRFRVRRSRPGRWRRATRTCSTSLTASSPSRRRPDASPSCRRSGSGRRSPTCRSRSSRNSNPARGAVCA